MAALRIFARSTIFTTKFSQEIGNGSKFIFTPIVQLDKRWASFKSSPVYDPNTKYTDFEVTRDPKEWAYVENLIPPKYIPTPPKSEELPSGWVPPKEEAKKLPYFVARSKNHMLSVYLYRGYRGMRRLTFIKKIQGDIVAMEAELKAHIESVCKKKIGSRINEPAGVIKFRGDFVTITKEWLLSKGF